MECLGVVLAIVALALLIGPSISAVVTIMRSRKDRRRIDAQEEAIERLRSLFERRTTKLRDDLHALRLATLGEEIQDRSAEEPIGAAADEPHDTVIEPQEPPPAEGAPTEIEPDTTEPAPTSDEGGLPLPPPLDLTPEPDDSSPPPRRIDWEQWVGVRGAAVLGGVVLALAALLFLRYSIEHGLIPPIVRVGIGFLTGLGAIVAAEKMRPRYEATANALSGAGAVILYGSAWAGRMLYGLIAPSVAWSLMVLITVACGLLAWRHRSLVIAILGLSGGFTTPLLLSAPLDRPIGLFAYVLLLDVGLLVLARRRGWPVLAWLSLGATVIYQLRWIVGRMAPNQALLGLAVLAVFGMLFMLPSPSKAHGDDRTERSWQLSRATALLFPFAFALYFAGNADLGVHLYAVAGLLALLSVAALWLGPRIGLSALAIAAAAADLAVVMVWIGRSTFTVALAWEAAGVMIGLALAFHLFLELGPPDRDEGALRATTTAGFVAAAGLLALTTLAILRSTPALAPWLMAWIVLFGLLARQAVLAGSTRLLLVATGELGLAFGLFFLHHRHHPDAPLPSLFFAIVVATAIALQALALRVKTLQRAADRAAALFPALLLGALAIAAPGRSLGPELYLGVTILLAVLAVLAVTRIPSSGSYIAVMVLLALTHTAWTNQSVDDLSAETALLGLIAQAFAVVIFTVWPFLAGGRFLGQRYVWYAAALAGPIWFLSLRELFEHRFGDSAIAILPVMLGALSLAAAVKGQTVGDHGEAQRRRNLVWFSAVALGFVSLAIPLQLEKEWVTIGWALNGLAVLALWRRVDHSGLKVFGLALLAATTARLLLNPALLTYYPLSEIKVFNWLMYTYLVPAAALLGSAALLRPLEVERRRDWERAVYAGPQPLGTIACGLSTILVAFAWINLTIFDYFAAGSHRAFSWERLPARDLTLSLAWVVFALALLALGLRGRSSGLRWISLTFLVLTIGKVFLYDLGELEDLYRVASLVGLAISLILVSLAYQRFVFGRREDE